MKKVNNAVGRASLLPDLRRYVAEAYRRRVFRRALREFMRDPWAALNRDSDVLERLIVGWGNTGWSAKSEYLSAVVDEFSRTDGPVLECGSGLSTIILAVLASVSGRVVWTLENSSEWAAKVSDELDCLGLESVRICTRPLKNYGPYSWYDPPLEEMPDTFSLVVCDGPPGSGHGGRFGMLPVMRDHLAPRLSILLDDTIRDDEKEIATRWSDVLGARVDIMGADQQFATIRTNPTLGEEGSRYFDGVATITVGIPAFNSEKTLSKSIESVLSQSRRDIRLLISDNCSVDGTKEECLKWVRRDPRVQYIRQTQNIGVFSNYNEVFLKCRTKYFKWLSSSDWCDEKFAESCIAALEANPEVVLACPQAMLVDEMGRAELCSKDFALEMSDPASRLEYLLNNIQLSNVFNGVVRARALGNTRLNKQFRGSDIVLLAELAMKGKFVLIPEPMWYRQMTPETASKLKSAEQNAEFFSGSPRSNDRFVTWKLQYFLFEAILRADIDWSCKLRCLVCVVRRSFWLRKTLLREALPIFGS